MSELSSLEKVIKYSFKDRSLLSLALTHSSYDGNKQRNNQRLEYLGDSVLQLVITEVLYNDYSDMSEGTMTRVRSLIVREESLYKIAAAMDLGVYLRLGRGEIVSNGMEKPSILADAVEAVLGAIYLDAGFDTAREVILDLFHDAIAAIPDMCTDTDYKSRLQHECVLLYNADVCYELVSSSGPAHNKRFTVRAIAGEIVLASATGKSKKQAEMEAARLSLEIIFNRM